MDMSQAPEGNLIPRGALQPAGNATPLGTAAAAQAALGSPAARYNLSAPDAAAITPGAVAARILSSCKKALLADWRLATVNVRQTAGVLSDWLRGRDPMITREQFAARWCHRAVLCALEELPGAQPVIHWSAQHPVPLPA
ncbi:hypothetical protein COCSUDRAFT_58732 [Coccomyxa subellipsoidea C-169]|uniref:Uncharacterized protein n=1 Tax=Coccomyxa subellipsoidea (strain C-169) TaxID=574566 RepID=I0YM30_COCSC|nr:hypothetical protein COCSUDRAFT_58732 [Coccomyxa subellipsoidea C-169]EIE19449.1 hypothetical protein COCSUDRAFT_58732 [Coccomyxa subellipsoidea C-169]|eukprot:XP_005643993.1 hypothetical protein COCSUDRAFT_58732 [Coccomyxa subellipsoidea C-169]